MAPGTEGLHPAGIWSCVLHLQCLLVHLVIHSIYHSVFVCRFSCIFVFISVIYLIYEYVSKSVYLFSNWFTSFEKENGYKNFFITAPPKLEADERESSLVSWYS